MEEEQMQLPYTNETAIEYGCGSEAGLAVAPMAKQTQAPRAAGTETPNIASIVQEGPPYEIDAPPDDSNGLLVHQVAHVGGYCAADLGAQAIHLAKGFHCALVRRVAAEW